MSDDDLIRRGDALKTVDEELRRYGFSAPEGRRYDMREAIEALPAVTVGLPTDCRKWPFYPIQMPTTKDGKGPATIGVDAASVSYEVWDWEFNTYASFENLPDAINEAMRLSIAALEPVAAPVALEAKMAALPQERQDRINAEADRLAALDDLARLGQEFDAETEAGGSIIQGLREALEYTKGMLVDAVKHDPAPDPAAIREAALREALKAIGDLSAEFSAGGSPTAAKVLELANDRILALIPKGADYE